MGGKHGRYDVTREARGGTVTLIRFSKQVRYFTQLESQSGFRKKHSCNTVLLSLLDKWLKNVYEEEITGAIFLDTRKAFDVVDHFIKET